MKKISKFLSFVAVFACNNAFAAASCDSGYTLQENLAPDTFTAPVNGLCTTPGYELHTIPDVATFRYTGVVIGDEITLCDNGYMSDSGCVSYAQDFCTSGLHNMAVDTGTFSAPVDNLCTTPGYEARSVPNDFTFKYSGVVAGDPVTLCNNGYPSSTSACVSYTNIGCQSGYYSIMMDSNTIVSQSGGVCASGYEEFSDTTSCDSNPGTTCVDISGDSFLLRFSDGLGNTFGGVCIDGGTIDLPENPSRPGYTFNGWVVNQ